MSVIMFVVEQIKNVLGQLIKIVVSGNPGGFFFLIMEDLKKFVIIPITIPGHGSKMLLLSFSQFMHSDINTSLLPRQEKPGESLRHENESISS